MLKKLDWYILKKFLSSFFFSIILFVFITVVIDISEKTDDFVKADLDAYTIFKEYYLGFIPHMVGLLFPLFVFIAVIFFTSKLAGRSEVIAMLASGISFNRFLRPYWIGAILLAIMLWLGLSYVIPEANKKRTKFQATYIDDNFNRQTSTTLYFRNDTTHFGQISYFDTASKRGSNFVLQNIQGNKVTENIRADNLVWDTTDNTWKITNVLIRTIDSLKETVRMQDTMVVKLNFKPAELQKGEYTKDILKSPELARYIRAEKLRGAENTKDLEVERYRRIATPLSLILLTIIGASVASRKVRGGSGLHLAIGFITAALFILTDRFSTIFSTKGDFHPLLAAWAPNIIFFFVAVYLYRMAPK